MVQAMIEIPNEANQILNMVKARYGLNTKSEAITRVILEYGGEILEPKLKPKFVKKIKELEKKGDFIDFNSVDELRKSIENA